MWKTVRKFGLEHCDLPTTVWNLSFLHKVICLLISTRYYTHVNIVWYIWTVIVFMCYMYVWMFSKMWHLLVVCVRNNDIESALYVFPLLITSLMGPLKLFFMYLWHNKMREIVDEYLDFDEQVTPDTRFSKNILKVLKQVKKRAFVYWILVTGNGIVYMAKPMITARRNFMNGLYNLYGFHAINETPYFEIAYTLMALSLFAICYPAATITSLHITLVGYTEAQMLALADDVKNLWSDANKYYQETRTFAIAEGRNENKVVENEININNERKHKEASQNEIINGFIKEKLYHIAFIHAKNTYLLKKIEVLFRGAIIVEFLFLIMGMTSYLLAGMEKSYAAVPFTLVQVSMDCITGQNVMDASIAFENAIYDSKWENFNVSNRKAILLILMNSQKNMTLSAGGIATLDFTSLMTIFRIIYSAYTALLSTVK